MILQSLPRVFLLSLSVLSLLGCATNDRSEVLQVSGGRCVAGEIVEIALELNDIDWTIMKYEGSCGCMSLSKGEEELRLPAKIKVADRDIYTLSIATAGRTGNTGYSVRFFGEVDGDSHERVYKVQLDVSPGWQVTPSRLVIEKEEPGSVVTASFEVTRAKAEISFELDEVRVSDESRLNVTFSRSDDDVEGPSEASKYIVQLDYLVPKENSTDYLTLYGMNEAVTLSIPVYCRVQNTIRVRPRLISVRKGELPMKRVLWIDHPRQAKLRLVSQPMGVETAIEDAPVTKESTTRQKVIISIPDVLDLDSKYSIELTCGDDAISIPLEVW